MAVPAEFFGVGSARIHLSNLQCTGSEAALTDCTFDATNQCSHNQDAGVMCGECTNEDIRIAYDSEIQTVEFCDYLFWNMCDNACQDMNGGKRYITVKHSIIYPIIFSKTTWSLFLWVRRDHSFPDEWFPTV